MSSKYRWVPAPLDYPGTVYNYKGVRRILEHHLVWWQCTGEVVPSTCVLHHKNENKSDNRVENLELLTRAAHTETHARKHPAMVAVECSYCGCSLTRTGRDVAFKTKKGQKFFCDGSCAAKYGHALRTGL